MTERWHWYCLGRPSPMTTWDAECNECVRRIYLPEAFDRAVRGEMLIDGKAQPYPCRLRRTWWATKERA